MRRRLSRVTAAGSPRTRAAARRPVGRLGTLRDRKKLGSSGQSYHSPARCAHQSGEVAGPLFAVEHVLMGEADLVEPVGVTEARVQESRFGQLYDGSTLPQIGEMRTLEPLLPHPQDPQVNFPNITAGSTAEHHHTAGRTHIHRSWQRTLTGMLEYDPGRYPLTQNFPDSSAERAHTTQPLRMLRTVLRGHPSPVRELAAVDHPYCAHPQAVIDLLG